MKRIVFILSVCISAIAGSAFAGSWVDDFEAGVGAWGGGDGLSNGISDSTNIHSGTKSMLCQQTPTETRPNRLCAQNVSGNPPTTGTVRLYVYDDGADIKAFDVLVQDDGVLTASLGLRDNAIGSATNYTYGFNGSNASTGIPRSIGWHKFEFRVNSSGTDLRIDNATFPGHTSAAVTQLRRVKIHTNFGSPTDPNNIWIDDARFDEGATVPPASSASNWQQYQ